MISLYSHNQTAYDRAIAMLAESGMAAIIHPTGTGKSLIGFRLAQDNPEVKICWLSPSEYIYKTQIENVKRIDKSFSDSNIAFYSYAKLMSMPEEDIAEIKPDYIVLDEFHRCGAEMWGKGVQTLLDMYPTVPVLGLSATNIRYLDNQRDMADELFDGNVASYMSLGEALVRGILPTPKYVTAVYSYQKQLKKYERRIKEHRSSAVVDEGQRILDKLKRALEKANGLPEIFNKYITERSGKYIVFCANENHMREMINSSYQWFYDIDPDIHIYRAYSDDPATSKAFAKFKKDNSEHLKLLFCINMLNEGVHVDDISGVILFRSTVSPIIYKQQIGRALAAGKGGTPLILDIVNNFENLYSIGTIEDEMKEAVEFFRANDMEGLIVNERFKIEDEVRDCRILFEQLNETLTASWELMYSYAKAYYNRNGNLNVPKRYKTAEGYSLGNWVLTQKRIYNGSAYGKLTKERIQKLESIGMQWDSAKEIRWEQYYTAAKEYYKEHGNLDVIVKYVNEDGLKLGNWISSQRAVYAQVRRGADLTPEKIEALNAIGMIWDKNDYLWKSNYAEAEKYYLENGNLSVPVAYVTESGFKLGAWIANIKSRYARGELSKEQIKELEKLNIVWQSKSEIKWQTAINAAKEYKKEHGDLNVPFSYKTSSGFALGKWVAQRRTQYKNGDKRLTTKRIDELNVLGMDWRTEDSWVVRYSLLKDYYEQNGNTDIKQDYVINGIWLGKWLYQQKKSKDKLTQGQITLLDDLQIDWSYGNSELFWQNRINEIKSLLESGKTIDEIKGMQPYGKWIDSKVFLYNHGKLPEEKKEQLEALGISFEKKAKQPKEDSKPVDFWGNAYTRAEQYYIQRGNLYVPNPYKLDDGFDLGYWVYNQRDKYKKGELTQEQIKKLEAIGMSWLTPSEYLWEKSFLAASEYFSVNGNLKVPVTYKTTDGVWLGRWISKQKKSRAELPIERVQRLEKIGIEWDKRAK